MSGPNQFLCHDVLALIATFCGARDTMRLRFVSKALFNVSRDAFPPFQLLRGDLQQEWAQLLMWKDSHLVRLEDRPWYRLSTLMRAVDAFNQVWLHKRIGGNWLDDIGTGYHMRVAGCSHIEPLYIPLPPAISAWIRWHLGLDDDEEVVEPDPHRRAVAYRIIKAVVGHLFLKPLVKEEATTGGGKKAKKGAGKKTPPPPAVGQTDVDSYPGIVLCNTAGDPSVPGAPLYRRFIPKDLCEADTFGEALEHAFDTFVSTDSESTLVGPLIPEQPKDIMPHVTLRWPWNTFYLRVCTLSDDAAAAVGIPPKEVGVVVFNGKLAF